MNSTAKRTCAVILLLITAALLIFIWGNSLMSRQQSHLQSEAALQAVSPLVGSMTESGLTEPMLRKIAHFAEFFAVSAALTLLLRLFRPTAPQLIFNCLSLGLMIAVVDESLQIVSARGPLVSDILLDFCGVIAGTVFALAITVICKKVFRKRFSSF
ncbi:MAG: VanZ family protein [Oscillospiraceae bacterium]|nr:VanZ family protein [Oscillospiraceae bacterium]